ncbi:hypothetical protein BJF81_02150 [Ornithinimicrobium sp. CNJ-824]|nr:hypothetical protein BJF81_02150 [Ornithinimicrobium sp. CNJ-824]
MAWDMSPEATTVPARERHRSSRVPPAARTIRSSQAGRKVDWAPRSEVLPTSSWSKRTTTGTAGVLDGSETACRSARTAA